MARYDVVIDESRCRGCSFCEKFCSRGCITTTGDKFNAQGYLVPSFVNPDRCTGCGFCAWLCGAFAVDIYKLG